MVYAWMIYFLHSDDPFAIVNHPLQPLIQHLHVILAPLMVLMLGHFAYYHAWIYWKSGTPIGQRSGLFLLIALCPMVFSGYALQISGTAFWRSLWGWVHLVFGLWWMVFYTGHFLVHAWLTKQNKPNT